MARERWYAETGERTMGMPEVRCSRCGASVTSGLRYCATCGEVVDAALVTELRELYATLHTLDTWINDGKGGHTILELRKDVMSRYLELRTPPASAPAPPQSATPRSVPADTPPPSAP